METVCMERYAGGPQRAVAQRDRPPRFVSDLSKAYWGVHNVGLRGVLSGHDGP